jgi:hypothetical protein
VFNESDSYHGQVLIELLHKRKSSLDLFEYTMGQTRIYIVNETLPIYCKYSTASDSPWTFSFNPQHKKVIELLNQNFGQCLVAMICGRDGITALNFRQVSSLLRFGEVTYDNITARRQPNCGYEVSGQKKRLRNRIALTNLSAEVDRHLEPKLESKAA